MKKVNLLLLVILYQWIAACSLAVTPGPAALPATALPGHTTAPSTLQTRPPAPIPTLAPALDTLACIPQSTHREQGRVTYVVDGDTIHVLINQREYKVRYIGMDTPEDTTRVDYFGPQATKRNRQLVAGKVVMLVKDVSEVDRYGRLLRYVIADGVFVNYELVIEGFANTASFPPDIACIPTFLKAERIARQAGAGLWKVSPAGNQGGN